jgi:hypothetical protein
MYTFIYGSRARSLVLFICAYTYLHTYMPCLLLHYTRTCLIYAPSIGLYHSSLGICIWRYRHHNRKSFQVCLRIFVHMYMCVCTYERMYVHVYMYTPGRIYERLLIWRTGIFRCIVWVRLFSFCNFSTVPRCMFAIAALGSSYMHTRSCTHMCTWWCTYIHTYVVMYIRDDVVKRSCVLFSQTKSWANFDESFPSK